MCSTTVASGQNISSISECTLTYTFLKICCKDNSLVIETTLSERNIYFYTVYVYKKMTWTMQNQMKCILSKFIYLFLFSKKTNINKH